MAARKLHPWLLRLMDGGEYGVHYIYNVRDGTIVQWTLRGGKYWDDETVFPLRSAGEVLSMIIRKIRTLEWVPRNDGVIDMEVFRQNDKRWTIL